MIRLLSILLLFSGLASAKLRLPKIFSDGAVLQRDTGAKVWGWADAGAEVKASFAGQTLTTKAGPKGAWSVTFQNLKANSTGQDLVIEKGTKTKVIKNVLVGEVWLASGQSNMEWRVVHSNGGKEEIASANDPLLRIFLSENVARPVPHGDWQGSWRHTEPKHTGRFTAVGYYFGKRLRQELGVPVGIIECSWGGKPIEAFISTEALKTLPEAKGLLEKKERAIAKWDPKVAKETFEKQKAEYQKKLAEWKKNKKGKKPRGPRRQTDPRVNPHMASTIYNGMIAPIVGYGIRGALWYQGESNANPASANAYEELLGCMVADWRKRWGSEFSFYYVQLANFWQPTTRPGVEHHWITVQDEMRRALRSIPKSGMAVINDIGEANDIHPRNKKDVAERLSRWALTKDYGKKDIILTGPLYAGMEEKEGKMIISFDHAPGLKSRDGGPLKHFEIAGEDGAWQWAQAKIEQGKVIVWSDAIKDPAKVRYAWATNPESANLVNKDGLPASCFTTE